MTATWRERWWSLVEGLGRADMTEHVLITKVSLTVNTEGVFRCCVI